MTRVFVATVLMALAAGAAQNDPAKPPDPKKRARELLDGAAEMAGGVKPEVGVPALMHVGDNYQSFDQKKALDFLKQAFTASAAVPPETESAYQRSTQSEIIRLTAGLDIPQAVAMLKQMPPPKTDQYDTRILAGGRVVAAMVQKEQMDAAIELIEYMGSVGTNIFWGASNVFGKLAPDDPRRPRVWGWAMSAYTAKPDAGFSDMLGRYWKELARSTAETSMRTVLNGILDQKSDFMGAQYTPLAIVTSKGAVTLPSRQDRDLFEIMHMVKEIDPRRAEDILATRPQLKSALERFPMGTRSMSKETESIYSFSGSSKSKDGGAQMAASINATALTQTRASAVLAALQKDPDKAFALLPGVPDQGKQAELLGTIARTVAETDPAKGRSVLTKCLTLLDGIKRPADRIAPFDAMAEAAARIKDDKLVWLAIDRMLADAASLYKVDTNADRPNRAWRDRWPSTMAYRRAVRRAATAFGLDAEPLLLKITDPEMQLFARIELASALLGRPRSDWRTSGGQQARNPF
jgi:hypothetical protein